MKACWLLLLLWLIPAVALGQDSQQLRARFGEPDILRFLSDPNIGINVQFAQNGQVCAIAIEPAQNLIRKSSERPSLMTSERISSLLERLVPSTLRGQYLGNRSESIGCAQTEVRFYTDLELAQSFDKCKLGPSQETRASAKFKKRSCRIFEPDQNKVSMPDSKQLEGQFGEPDIERYLVGPIISVEVQYTAGGDPCQIRIEPPHDLIPGKLLPSPLMPSNDVTKLLDQLSPPHFRGGNAEKIVTHMGCNSYQLETYQHVQITRSQHNCQPESPDRDMQATIQYLHRSCRNSQAEAHVLNH